MYLRRQQNTMEIDLELTSSHYVLFRFCKTIGYMAWSKYIMRAALLLNSESAYSFLRKTVELRHEADHRYFVARCCSYCGKI